MDNKNKKTVINYDLAHALMKAGMEHFDAGGIVPTATAGAAPGSTVAGSAPQGGGLTSVWNPTQSIPALANPSQSIANTGSGFKEIGSDFTTQSGYQAQDPYSLGQQQGVFGQTQSVQQQQQALAQALVNQSNGVGPNPAQLQEKQNADQAIANETSAIAANRGINPGLATRLAGQNAAQQGQAAVSNEGVLQAQQELGAQSQLAGVYGQTANEDLTQQEIMNQALNNQQNINANTAQNNANAVNKTTGGLLNGAGALASLLNKGGKVKTVDALVSPGERILNPKEAEEVAKGKKNPEKAGKKVPGEAMVEGDSEENDNVKKKLDKGGVVIPRTLEKSKDPEKKRKFVAKSLEGHDDPNEFIKALMSGGKVTDGDDSYVNVLKAKKKASDYSKRLKKGA